MSRWYVRTILQLRNLLNSCCSNLAFGMMLATMLPLVATPAAGQQAGNQHVQADQLRIEEIIVSAQRRAELLCDTPISMTTISVADFTTRNSVIVIR